MYRGTTPSLVFNVSIDTDDIVESYITIKSLRDPKKIITKTQSRGECVADYGCVMTTLSQQDTLNFDGKEKVQVQLRILTKSNGAYASEIFTSEMGEILQDGEIQ